MNIGKAIKLCRTQRGISQVTLAQSLDLTPAMISMIESEKREVTLTQLTRISSALRVPVTILIFLGANNDELENLDSDLKEKISKIVLDILKDSD